MQMEFHALVYFPIDKEFVIVDSLAIKGRVDHDVLKNVPKFICDVVYDGKVFNAIIVQIGNQEGDLHETLRRVREYKREKKMSIVNILDIIPRIRPAGRQKFRTLKVRCLTVSVVNLCL